MTESKFKIGDRVRCISAAWAKGDIIEDVIYEVMGIDGTLLELKGAKFPWFETRFGLAGEEKEKTPQVLADDVRAAQKAFKDAITAAREGGVYTHYSGVCTITDKVLKVWWAFQPFKFTHEVEETVVRKIKKELL